MVILNKIFLIIVLNIFNKIFCFSEFQSIPSDVLRRIMRSYHNDSNENIPTEREFTIPEEELLYETTIDIKKDELMNLDTAEFLNIVKNEDSEYVDNIIGDAMITGKNIVLLLKDQIEKKTKSLPLLSPNKQDNLLRNIREQEGTSGIERYSFMSSIQIFDECSCAGAIIQRNVIIVAASCLQRYDSYTKNSEEIKVRVGSDFCDKDGQLVTVHKIYFHPLYDSRSLLNNLALIQVKGDLLSNRNNNITSILIEYNGYKLINNGVKITLLGWGAKEKQGKNNSLSKRLMKTEQTLYGIEKCRQTYKRLTDKTFCGNCVTQQEDCNKDVGNLALVKGKLAGIVSFGPSRCDVTSPPTVFTKLSSYKFWIDNIISLAMAELTGKVAQSPSRKRFSKLNDINETYTQNKNTNRNINNTTTQNTISPKENEKMEEDDILYRDVHKMISDAFFQSRRKLKSSLKNNTATVLIQTSIGHYDRQKTTMRSLLDWV